MQRYTDVVDCFDRNPIYVSNPTSDANKKPDGTTFNLPISECAINKKFTKK